MPRKPTGRPRGRQLGSGKLGLGTQDEHDRVTLRIPHDLYTRLEAFAAGRHFHRGSPKLAACIRDALDHYLSCPIKGQTSNVPGNGRQTSNVPGNGQYTSRQVAKPTEGHEDNTGQTNNVPSEALEASWHNTRQTSNIREDDTEEVEHDNWQTSNTAHPMPLDAADLEEPVAIVPEPAYDPKADELGPLCENNHNYQGTGQSPRRKSDNECRQCRRDRNAAYKARKRQAAPVA